MRRWGIVITAVYLLILAGLLLPAFVYFAGDDKLFSAAFVKSVREVAGSAWVWAIILILLGSQALLLFLSVDTSQKKLKPRAHIAVTCGLSGLLFAGLTYAAVLSAVEAAPSKSLDDLFSSAARSVAIVVVLWVIWGVAFYLYLRNASTVTTKAVSWLLKGSVLELLITVPCHIIVRRRGECSAPIATSFGICTGIAIMLLSFGPGILFLYKKRLDAYTHPQAAAQPRG